MGGVPQSEQVADLVREDVRRTARQAAAGGVVERADPGPMAREAEHPDAVATHHDGPADDDATLLLAERSPAAVQRALP